MSRFDDAEFSSNPSIDVSAEMEAAISTAKTALQVLTEIMNDPKAETEHRLQAATYLANVAMQARQMKEYRSMQEHLRQNPPSEGKADE